MLCYLMCYVTELSKHVGLSTPHLQKSMLREMAHSILAAVLILLQWQYSTSNYKVLLSK